MFNLRFKAKYFILFYFLCLSYEVLSGEQNYGSWGMVCDKLVNNDSEKYCVLSQRVAVDPQGVKTIMGVSIYKSLQTNQPMIDFRVSSSALFEAGIGVKIQNKEYRLKMTQCNEDICLASGEIDEDILIKLKSNESLQVAFFLPPKKQITIPVSLNGFSIAYEALMRE